MCCTHNQRDLAAERSRRSLSLSVFLFPRGRADKSWSDKIQSLPGSRFPRPPPCSANNPPLPSFHFILLLFFPQPHIRTQPPKATKGRRVEKRVLFHHRLSLFRCVWSECVFRLGQRVRVCCATVAFRREEIILNNVAVQHALVSWNAQARVSRR